MPGIVVILLLSAMVVGLALLVGGIRGRKLNNHPVCAWCKFDLEGVYPESITCPECGAGLKRERAVRTGVRRRMPGLILLGALLAAVPLAPIGTIAWALVTGTNIDSYKPLGLLLWEAKHSDTQRLDAIAAEIQARLMGRTVAPSQYQRVVEATLELQGDTSRPWSEAWGDLIERAKLDGVLTQEDEDRFHSQAAVIEVQTRPTAQAGGVIPARLKLKEARVGSSTALTCSVRVKGVAIDGRDAKWDMVTAGADPFFGDSFFKDGSAASFQLQGKKASRGGIMFFGGAEPTGDLVIKVPEDAVPGEKSLDLVLQNSIGDGAMGLRAMTLLNGRLKTTSSQTGSTVASSASTPVRVVGPNDAVVTPVPADSGTAAALASAMRPESVTIGSSMMEGLVITPNGVENAGDGNAHVRFKVKDLPAPVAFDVYCRANGKEWKLGQIHSGSSAEDSSGGGLRSVFSSMTTITINGKTVTKSSSSSDGNGREVSGAWEGGDAEKVDLILKPSSDVAARTLDLDTYYSGTVTIHDVPVVRDPMQGMADPFGQVDRLFRMQQRNTPPRTRPSPDGSPVRTPRTPKGPL